MTRDAFVCCAVGNGQYALRATDVRQIVRVERMRETTAADGRAGVLDFAGATVPVFPLGRAFGHGSARVSGPVGRHIVVTGHDGDLIGWLVDGVERTPVDDDTVMAPLPSMVGPRATRWFMAIVRRGEQSMLLLAPRGGQSSARPPLHAGVSAPISADRSPAVLVFGSSALPPTNVSRFALSCRRVVGVAQDLSLTPVPGSARHVAGLAWWRNAAMPVVDFRGGTATARGSRQRCLIVRGSERSGAAYVGLPVDADVAMHRPSPEDRPAAGVSCPPFASGVFDVAGHSPIALLDIDTLLASETAPVEEVA